MFDHLKETYFEKKVFVTGHTGFKGSWLIEVLHLLGAKIRGYALKPENHDDLYYMIKGDTKCYSQIDDIRDKVSLNQAILDFDPDFVFHLAAQPLVKYSYEYPAETFEVNAIGTAYLLDAVRLLEKKCTIVLITTDKVYHNNEWVHPYRESDKLGGYDPYSASKACTELVIESYRNSFFSNENFDQHQKAIGVGRAGNVIGGGDWSKDRLIPDIVKALLTGTTIVVRNPTSVRPWQHVIEPILGYLKLGKYLSENHQKFGQAYNFGPQINDSIPVIDMVKMVIEKWGNGYFEISKLLDQPHEAGLLKLDISKAISELQWTPKMNASMAVDYTIQWYKAYSSDPSTIDLFTKDQILSYFKLN